MCSVSVSDKSGHAVYTVLWTPPRYTQLFAYVFVLVLLLAVVAGKMAVQLWRREKKYTPPLV